MTGSRDNLGRRPMDLVPAHPNNRVIHTDTGISLLLFHDSPLSIRLRDSGLMPLYTCHDLDHLRLVLIITMYLARLCYNMENVTLCTGAPIPNSLSSIGEIYTFVTSMDDPVFMMLAAGRLTSAWFWALISSDLRTDQIMDISFSLPHRQV